MRHVTQARTEDFHVHLDTDGERVCEDSRCPSRRATASLEPIPFGTLHHRALGR